MPIARARFATPLGLDLCVGTEGGSVVESAFVRRSRAARVLPADPLLREAEKQVGAYFARRLVRFDLPLAFEGTPLMRRIYELVATLAFGELVSYGDVARAIGRPGAHRAVATTMGRSTIDLFMPAHRVVGADGRIKGAGAGSMRLRLLEHEGVHLRPPY